MWIIEDWAGNRKFPNFVFDTFEDGWDFLRATLPEEDWQEFSVERQDISVKVADSKAKMLREYGKLQDELKEVKRELEELRNERNNLQYELQISIQERNELRERLEG